MRAILFFGKCLFFRNFAILTPWNELKFASRCFQTCNLWTVFRKKASKSLCTLFRKYLRILTFSILALFKTSSMRYIKLQLNWDEEFISVVKTDIGEFWSVLVARCYHTCKLTYNSKNLWIDDPKCTSARSECSNYIFDPRNSSVPNFFVIDIWHVKFGATVMYHLAIVLIRTLKCLFWPHKLFKMLSKMTVFLLTLYSKFPYIWAWLQS